MKAFIYARTSTNHTDPQDQVTACKKYAEQNGYEVSEIFIDAGFSGLNKERPSYQKLLNSLNDSNDYTVIAYSPGSISRDMADIMDIRRKCHIKTVTGPEIPDEKMMDIMLHASIALKELESNLEKDHDATWKDELDSDDES